MLVPNIAVDTIDTLHVRHFHRHLWLAILPNSLSKCLSYSRTLLPKSICAELAVHRPFVLQLATLGVAGVNAGRHGVACADFVSTVEGQLIDYRAEIFGCLARPKRLHRIRGGELAAVRQEHAVPRGRRFHLVAPIKSIRSQTLAGMAQHRLLI